jgi:F420-dependent oxidoreductase-like protein
MRIAISVAYWPWFSYEEQIALAEEADAVGLDSVWVSEAWGQDAVSILSILADRTERVGLGSGVFQIPARQPTATAMAAATIDAISGGRFRLGLGVSGPQVSEGWYGVPFTRPVSRTREYVEIVRKALNREVVAYEGREWQLPTPDGIGLGKPLKLMIKPGQERIPIYLGSIGPKAIEQTGELADGWLPAFFNPFDADVLWNPLDAGLAAAGRTRADIDVLPGLPLAVEDTIEAAHDAVRPWITFYLGGMGAKNKNFYVDLCEKYGFGEAANEVQDRFLAGDRMGAARAVTTDIIEIGSIACTPDQLTDRLRPFRDAGVDGLVAVPFGSDRARAVRLLGESQAALAA